MWLHIPPRYLYPLVGCYFIYGSIIVIVEAQNLCHYYRRSSGNIAVLDNVEFTLGQGEFAAIMGASGSGKSTFLHILGCLLKPVSGSYRLNGEEITDLEEKRLAEIRSRHIGHVFQMFYLLPGVDVARNVSLPLVYGNVEEKEVQRRVLKAIQQVGLEDRLSHKPAELSGGEMQRAAIARVLAQNPELILADEPTGNLDRTNSIEILNLFKHMNEQGHTIILVTHDPEVADYAQKQMILNNGSFRRA